MSAEAKVLEALETAPYLVNHNGVWVPREEIEHEEDFAINLDYYSQMPDDYEIGVYKDGFRLYQSQIIVPGPDEFRELVEGAYAVQGMDPADNTSAIDELVEHEMDHLRYAVDVLKSDDWELGMAFFRFPEAYLRKMDSGCKRVFSFTAFAVGSMVGPKAGIAGVYANPLEPSDGDINVCAEYGYDSLEAVGEAVERIGLPLPRSAPRVENHLDLDEIPSERGVVLIRSHAEVENSTVESSLAQIATVLGNLAGKNVRETATGIEDRIAALDQLIDSPELVYDESRAQQLRIARENLCAAFEALAGGANSVRTNITSYLSDAIGDM